jgi:serine/threonine protein kinase
MGNCNFRPEVPEQTSTVSKNNFVFHYVVGKGGFGKVWKVESKKNKLIYAMKEMSKSKVITKRSVNSVMNERHLLSTLKHPSLVNMIHAFQDRENLYLIMELMPGGDLRYHISKKRRFSEEQTKFFVACIMQGLEYLHMNGCIHRDIKPENLVLDHKGYVRITDLGIARIWRPENSSDTSGTPGYMAPEVMCRQNHGVAVDYFALGVMAYEFMMGRRPYQGRSRKEIRDQILAKQVQIKKHEIPEGWSLEAADFVNRLIQRKPANRLGLNGPAEIKSHPWIKDYPWGKLERREIEAPFIPNQDEDNFDRRQQITQEGTNPDVAKQNALMLRRNSVQSLFDGYHFDGASSAEKATNNSGMGSQRTNSTASFSGKTSILY